MEDPQHEPSTSDQFTMIVICGVGFLALPYLALAIGAMPQTF